MNSTKVAFFWDYENCPPPTDIDSPEKAVHLINRIKSLAGPGGTVLFRAYLDTLQDDVTKPRYARFARLLSDLFKLGVDVLHCPHDGRKNVVDERILVDMLLFAFESATPTTIVLITGDGDFTYAVSQLTRKGHTVIVVGRSGASFALKSVASKFIDWETLGDPLSPHEGAPCVQDPSFSGSGVSDITFATAREGPLSPEIKNIIDISRADPNKRRHTVGSAEQGLMQHESRSASRATLPRETPDAFLSSDQSSQQGKTYSDVLSTQRLDTATGSNTKDATDQHIFEPLIQIIKRAHGEAPGQPRMLRSRAGEELQKEYPELYRGFKIKNFREYVKKAEQAGLIELGGGERKEWIQLKLLSDGFS